MIHLPIVHVCSKFQFSRPHSSWEKCDDKVQCFENWRERKIKNKGTNGRISSSSLIPVYTMHLPTVHVCTKFQPSRPYSSWENCDEKFQCLKIGEKEKWRNKGMNTQQQPDSGLHDAFAHCPRVYQVWRKFLLKIGEKKNEKKKKKIKGRIRATAWFRYKRYIHSFTTCLTSFNLLGFTVTEKSVTKNFNVWKLERMKNEEIKALIRSSSQMIRLPIVHVCTKFQSSRLHSSWENCDDKF